MYGLPEMPIQNINISNVNFTVSGSDEGIYAVAAIDIDPSYGEGIFLKNTENIQMANVSITCKAEKTIVKNSRNVILNGNKIS